MGERMAAGQSLIYDGVAVIRLRAPLRTRRRFVLPHGQHGSLLALPLELALELVEAGLAKTPSAYSRGQLRRACHEARERAAAPTA